MAVKCDVIVKREATPEQLAALGSALWRWCNRTAGRTGIYQYLDSQPLADLIAGKLANSGHQLLYSDRRGVHFQVRDEASHNSQEAIDGLRQDLPTEGIEDVVVDGISWSEGVN